MPCSLEIKVLLFLNLRGGCTSVLLVHLLSIADSFHMDDGLLIHSRCWISLFWIWWHSSLEARWSFIMSKWYWKTIRGVWCLGNVHFWFDRDLFGVVNSSKLYKNHHHHQSLKCEGRWGTTDDFATSFLHFSLFSTALWDLPISRLVHSLIYLPTSSSICLVFFSLSPCLARLFWPDLVKGQMMMMKVHNI